MYKVIVAGSINMDVVARTNRHPVRGETVLGQSLNFFPGGKGANQAVAAARQGAQTVMLGKVGKDGFADELLAFLSSQEINTQYISSSSGSPTGTAIIVISAEGDNTIVVVPGANGELLPSDTSEVEIQKGDVLLSQLEIPQLIISDFFRRGRSVGATTVLNPAPAIVCKDDLFKQADIVVVNETELGFYVGKDVSLETTESAIIELAIKLRRFPEQVIVVTLGARGIIAVLNEMRIVVAGRKVDVIDTTGAGDCFLGSMAAALSKGATPDKAIKIGNIAASLCVTRMGAGVSMPTTVEVSAITGTR
jgi:ribokinase